MYHLLTGKFPFGPGPTAAVLGRVPAGTPHRVERHRPDLPARLAEAVHRALAADPADRFPDVSGFAAALQRAAG